jgi:hypothetical protein
MEPSPRFGTTSKIRELEKRLNELSGQNSTRLSPQSILANIEAKKLERYNQAIDNLESQYVTEVANTFDLSNKNNLLIRIATFTVVFIADNASNIMNLTGMALIGSVRYDLAIQLMLSLFDDISEKLLGTVIQHVYELTYKKEGDQKTIEISENHVKELDISNFPDEKKNSNPEMNEVVEPQKKVSQKNSLKCHIM